MKIAVYAIAHNEAGFLRRWYNCVKEADYVCVLDTGSTDSTYALCKKLGIITSRMAFVPFHFGMARNASMSLIPADADICVCMDIDETISPGWAEKVRKAFTDNPDATCGWCKFITSFKPDGKTPNRITRHWKIYRNHIAGAEWKARVHEYLVFKEHREVFIPNVTVEHHPDTKKSRRQYLDLLATEAKENPDQRSLYYFGRELMNYKKYDEAIAQFMRYLASGTMNYRAEHTTVLRYIGRCYGRKGDYPNAVKFLRLAVEDSPAFRESACELAELALSHNDMRLAKEMAELALSRTERPQRYPTEEDCWTWKPYDIMSRICIKSGDIIGACQFADSAYRAQPSNERLRKNAHDLRKLAFHKGKRH